MVPPTPAASGTFLAPPALYPYFSHPINLSVHQRIRGLGTVVAQAWGSRPSPGRHCSEDQVDTGCARKARWSPSLGQDKTWPFPRAGREELLGAALLLPCSALGVSLGESPLPQAPRAKTTKLEEAPRCGEVLISITKGLGRGGHKLQIQPFLPCFRS